MLLPRRYRALDLNLLSARQRFRAKLPRRENASTPEAAPEIERANEWGIGELFVSLLQVSEIEPTRLVADGQRYVDEFRARVPELRLSWDDLVKAGWLRVLGEQWAVCAKPGPSAPTDPSLRALRALLTELYALTLGRRARWVDVEFAIAEHRLRHPTTPDLRILIGNVVTQEGEALQIVRGSTYLDHYAPWALARVWERRGVGPSRSRERLCWWRQRARVPYQVHYEAIVRAFSAHERAELTAAVWDELSAEPDFVGWENEGTRLVARLACETGRMETAAFRSLPRPTTLFERFEWLDQAAYLNDPHVGRGFLLQLLRALLVIEQETAAGHKRADLVSRVLVASDERPALLDSLRMFLAEHPEGIVDVLIDGRYAGVGLAILANAAFHVGATGFDEGSEDQEESSRRREIWRDGCEFAIWAWGRQGDAAATDVADTLHWLFSRREPPSYGQFSRRVRDWPHQRALIFAEHLASLPCGGAAVPLIGPLGEAIGLRLLQRLPSGPDALTSGAFAGALFVASSLRSQSTKAQLAQQLAAKYSAALGPHDRWNDEKFEPLPYWTAFADLLRREAPESWRVLLNPPLAGVLGEPFRWHVLRVRTHLRLLAWLAADWRNLPQSAQSGPPSDLCDALCSLLERFAEVAFDPEADTRTFVRRVPLQPLAEDVSQAINALDSGHRQRAIDGLVNGPLHMRSYARFGAHLVHRGDRDRVFERLEKLSPTRDMGAASTLEITETIAAFLDVRRLDAVESLVERFDREAAVPASDDWALWRYQLDLRLAVERGRWEGLDAPFPKPLRASSEAREAREFYRGLAALRRTPAEPSRARAIFERLRSNSPDVPGHAVNLFGAAVAEAFAAPDTDDITKFTERLRETLRIGEEATSRFATLPFDAHLVYANNRFRALAGLEDWTTIIQEYEALPNELRVRTGEFAIRAFSQLGSHDEASRLATNLQDALDPAFLASLQLAADERRRVDPIAAARFVTASIGDPVAEVQAAVTRLRTLSPSTQARVLGRESLEALLVEQFVETAREIAQLAPSLAYAGQTPEEDRLTDLLLALLSHRVQFLGWHVSGQGRRGYTAVRSEEGRKGVGEADVELHADRRVAQAEALILGGKDTAKTQEHIAKVFRYGLPDLAVSFVVVWLFGDAERVWEEFCSVAAAFQVPGFPAGKRTVVDEIERRGIRAMRVPHLVEGGREHVVYHLGVDLSQTRRRAAAGQAPTDAPSPRPE